MKPNYSPKSAELYADTETPALPATDMTLDRQRVAFVVIDPQVDVMSEKGLAWAAVGESVTENNLVPNLVELFGAAKKAGIVVAVSPHYYYHWDHDWRWQAPLERFQHDVGAFDRTGPYEVGDFRGSGADFMEEFKPFIEDGRTIICSPHKLYGPQANDLKFQLGKQGVNQVILAGMLANMCVESHMRDLLEAGFEVAVVRDAVAAPKLPDGDGYLAALINYRFMANAVWSTDETVEKLLGMAG
ncbi:isochorismatase family protein [Novosphingobium kaempferiae]|uniref:isochorismatase family protein n=1 Tax=Novosphingobium kaempferiae TaxID=2896849 RepID=UPI001E64889C|nr:isochorismatase family protein [Novosphingobium kaempferiae]